MMSPITGCIQHRGLVPVLSLGLPHHGVACQGRERTQRRDVKALPPIQEAPAQAVGPVKKQTYDYVAIDFPGANAGVVWNDVSPRLGFTYDLTGQGKSLVRGSYSLYFGQMGPGQLTGNLVAISQVSIRYPWADLNGDSFVQANELDLTKFKTKSTAFDPANPTAFSSPGRVDPGRVGREAAGGGDEIGIELQRAFQLCILTR